MLAQFRLGFLFPFFVSKAKPSQPMAHGGQAGGPGPWAGPRGPAHEPDPGAWVPLAGPMSRAGLDFWDAPMARARLSGLGPRVQPMGLGPWAVPMGPAHWPMASPRACARRGDVETPCPEELLLNHSVLVSTSGLILPRTSIGFCSCSRLV